MVKSIMRRNFLLFLLCAFSFSSIAQEDESALSISLDSIIVKGYRNNSPIKTIKNGITVWNLEKMNLLPQIFGAADPMRYAQTLPGIQTNGEYRSGINIEGCENQHNTISIEGVPVYNVNHLLGFFSVFNTSHYSSLSISKGIISAGSPNRLGGQFNMLHRDEISDSLNGIVSLGLISSLGTINIPVNNNTAISASLRGSYLNLLYNQWLKADGQQINYSFYDANFSVFHRIDNDDKLLFDFYSGRDNGKFGEGRYLADMEAKWGNIMGAIHWKHTNEDISSKTTGFVTSYKSKYSLDMQGIKLHLPSGITDIGLKNDTEWKRWETGFEISWHDIQPQSLERQGSANMSYGNSKRLRSLETSLYLNYNFPIIKNLNLSCGIRGSIFKQEETAYYAVDPSLRMFFINENFHVSATYALRHQFLFQTGFSDIGLPTEFWISATKDFEPQYTHEFSINSSSFFFNRRFRLSLDIFYRKLHHQLGYKGSVLDYVNDVYNIYKPIMHGHGENYGVSIMLNKFSGRLTGWIGYTFTHARRSFNEIGREREYPASHERPHEINALLTYSLGKRWTFSSNFVYASGTPFTAAQYIYLLNGNLIINHGEYNASRLRSYMRLDFSANYKWFCKGEQGLNISLYNLTSHNNELFYFLSTYDDGSFAYRPVTFFFNILPSISYYYKF